MEITTKSSTVNGIKWHWAEAGADEWLEYNREMSEIWPNITMKIDPLPDYEKYTDEEGKFQKYGSKKPGTI